MIAYINSLHCHELFHISLSNSPHYIMIFFLPKIYSKNSWLDVDNKKVATIQKSRQRFLDTICTQQQFLVVGSGLVVSELQH